MKAFEIIDQSAFAQSITGLDSVMFVNNEMIFPDLIRGTFTIDPKNDCPVFLQQEIEVLVFGIPVKIPLIIRLLSVSTEDESINVFYSAEAKPVKFSLDLEAIDCPDGFIEKLRTNGLLLRMPLDHTGGRFVLSFRDFEHEIENNNKTISDVLKQNRFVIRIFKWLLIIAIESNRIIRVSPTEILAQYNLDEEMTSKLIVGTRAIPVAYETFIDILKPKATLLPDRFKIFGIYIEDYRRLIDNTAASIPNHVNLYVISPVDIREVVDVEFDESVDEILIFENTENKRVYVIEPVTTNELLLE
jgi:hypothetical protein